MCTDRLIESVKNELEELFKDIFKNMSKSKLEALGLKKDSVKKTVLTGDEKKSINAESDPAKQRDLTMELILRRLYWGARVGTILKPLKGMDSEGIFRDRLSKLGNGMKDPEIVLDMANNIQAMIGQNTSANKIKDELAGTLIHFNAKITHSSANGGVLIGNDRKADLPYLFSATLQNEFRPLDLDRYSAATNVMPNKAIRLMNSRPVQPKDAIDHMIVNAVASMPAGPVVESVCPFLKQIVVPGMEEGEHVILSPMSATGIMRLIGENSVKQVTTKKGKDIEVSAFSAERVSMSIGGSKQNNVSAASKMTLGNAYLFETPERNYSLRRVYSLAMRDYSVLMDKGYASSIVEYNRHNAESSKDTISARNWERSGTPIVSLVKEVCGRLNNDMDLVSQARVIVGEDKFSAKLDAMAEKKTLNDISSAILNGKFNDSAIDSVRDAIFNQLKLSFKDAKVAYPDATASRHKEIIREVLVRNLPCTK